MRAAGQSRHRRARGGQRRRSPAPTRPPAYRRLNLARPRAARRTIAGVTQQIVETETYLSFFGTDGGAVGQREIERLAWPDRDRQSHELRPERIVRLRRSRVHDSFSIDRNERRASRAFDHRAEFLDRVDRDVRSGRRRGGGHLLLGRRHILADREVSGERVELELHVE